MTFERLQAEVYSILRRLRVMEYQNLIFRDTPKNEPIKLVRNSKNESPIKLEYKKVVYEFNSLRECGRQLGISTGNLSRLISGKMNYYKGIKILQ